MFEEIEYCGVRSIMVGYLVDLLIACISSRIGEGGRGREESRGAETEGCS